MLTPRQARFAFLPLMLIAMSALAGIAVVLFEQGVAAGLGETLMLAWVLAFIVLLPTAMLVLPVVGAVLARLSRSGAVPHSGVKIP